ncbi:hypothetical protein Avbf_01959 [Armadillidium vulgare]|nr:hypothetical protein Avbf_01959 [Armadillidium vulgare]
MKVSSRYSVKSNNGKRTLKDFIASNSVFVVTWLLFRLESFLILRAPLLSRSNSVSSRRSLQLHSQSDPEKQFRVTLPDNQVRLLSFSFNL